MDAGYPRRITLKSGSVAVLRPLLPTDEGGLLDFYRSLPAESTQFLKRDVRDAEVIRRWVHQRDPEEVWSVLALSEGGRVIGDGTLYMSRSGWRRHVGEVRLVVAPEFEHQHLASNLLHELVNRASLRSLRKLEAQILDAQAGALRAFERLGFREEARLARHAVDLKGEEHDLLILTITVEDLWKTMENLIHDMEFAHRDGY